MTTGGSVRTSQILISDPPRLPQSRQQRPVHGGGIVADGVLAAEEYSWRVLDHVVALAGVAGDDGRGQDIVVVAAGSRVDETVTSS